MLNINDAARYLGVREGTIRRFVQEGKLTFVFAPSGQRRIEKKQLDDLKTCRKNPKLTVGICRVDDHKQIKKISDYCEKNNYPYKIIQAEELTELVFAKLVDRIIISSDDHPFELFEQFCEIHDIEIDDSMNQKATT
jgi:excisionase family DNA binding protein